MKNTYNVLTKNLQGKEYIITDMIATKLNKKQFEKIQQLNMDLLGAYRFVDYNETDFTWWDTIDKYLTSKKLSSARFVIDYYGNVTKY